MLPVVVNVDRGLVVHVEINNNVIIDIEMATCIEQR